MDLIVDEVVQLEEVDIADGDGVVERLAGAAVVEDALAVGAQAGLLEAAAYVVLGGAVEYRRRDFPAERLGGIAEVDLKHLSDVHSGRDAQGVQDYVERGSVRHIGHVFLGKYAGDDALVSVASGHLVADGDLALLRDVHADDLVYAGGQLVAGLTGEALHVDDYAALTVRHLERSVAHLAGLFAEDGAQQALLGSEVGLALGRDLSDEDVAGMHLGADHDDAVLIEVLERVLADAGDIAGDLLGAELGVTGVALILLHMDGGEHVVHDEALVEEYGVLIVVAFPGHESDEDVLAEAELALGRGGSVGDDLPLGHALAARDYRALVEAGALVRTLEFKQLIIFGLAAVILNSDVGRADVGDDTVSLGDDDDSGVDGTLVLYAGGDYRGLCREQGHGLTLHVGAHERAVRVVVLQERDHGRGYGDHHARGDIHEIDSLAVDLDDLVAVAADDTLVCEAAVLIERLGRLGDDVLVLLVCGEVHDLVGHAAGAFLNAAVGGDNEAVFINSRIAGEIGDKADVRALRRLYRAEAAIVAVVDVAHLEARALSRQAAGSEGGHAALVRELGEGVRLVHELAQRAGAEELLDGSRYRADIDEALRGDDVEVLQSHALADDALHAGKSDAELVLQQLADTPHAAVAEMVDVVLLAYAVSQAVEVVDGGKDIVDDDVLGDEVVDIVGDGLLELLAGVLLEQLAEDDEADFLFHADLGGVEIDKILESDHTVGEHSHILAALELEVHVDNTAARDLFRHLAGDDGPGVGNDLARERVADGHGELEAGYARIEREFLVEFIAADSAYVIAAAVEEQAVKQALGAVDGRGIAGAELAVDLEQGLLACAAGVALESGEDALVIIEHGLELLVGGGADYRVGAAEPGIGLVGAVDADGLEQPGDRQLAVFVYADIEHVVEVGLILEPRAVIRDGGRAVNGGLGLVRALIEVNAGAPDYLGDNDTLGAIDDESAALCHDREIAHEDLLLFDLLGLLIAEADIDLERGRIVRVARLALLDGVLGLFVHGVVHEAEFEVARIVGYGCDVFEHVAQPLFKEPFVGTLLNLEQVRHVLQLLGAGKALTHSLAVADVFWHLSFTPCCNDRYARRSCKIIRQPC